MIPYRNVLSQNLTLLLLLARVTAYLGITMSLVSVVNIVMMAFTLSLVAFTNGVALISLSVAIVFLSGLMAAVVAFEENYRLRTVLAVAKDKNLINEK